MNINNYLDMHKKNAVYAFDLDDTLYKEMDFVASGYRAVAAVLATETGVPQKDIETMIMQRRPRGFEFAIEATKSKHSVDELVEIYRSHRPNIIPETDALPTLEALKAAGAALVLITDGSTRHQRSKIKALGIEKFFDMILVSEETGGDKTTEIPWQMVETHFGALRRFYIADNMAKDFHLPNLRGWHTIMLRDRRHRNVFPQQPLNHKPEYRPQTTIDRLGDLFVKKRRNILFCN